MKLFLHVGQPLQNLIELFILDTKTLLYTIQAIFDLIKTAIHAIETKLYGVEVICHITEIVLHRPNILALLPDCGRQSCHRDIRFFERDAFRIFRWI